MSLALQKEIVENTVIFRVCSVGNSITDIILFLFVLFSKYELSKPSLGQSQLAAI